MMRLLKIPRKKGNNSMYTEVILLINGWEYDAEGHSSQEGADACVERFKKIPDDTEPAEIHLLPHHHPMGTPGRCECATWLTDHRPVWTNGKGFTAGDRVTAGNLTGTVLRQVDGVVELEWDDAAGPQEDEVHVSLLQGVGK